MELAIVEGCAVIAIDAGAVAAAALHLPVLIRAWLWIAVAWLLLCRLRQLGPDSRLLINVSLSLATTGALGQALAVVVPFSATQLRAIDLATAGGLFAYLLAFTPEWSRGAPAITRRVDQRDIPGG